ncbi:hypothetical protein [Nonomuraea sp. NPDC050691]|uniref:hypothetical protein n=1 Tax=Nonomuraea sp. NPDC050691 TaxID=3155661 RepID=UPI0033C1347F
MSDPVADLLPRVRRDLLRAGFHLDEAPTGAEAARAGLFVYALPEGVGVRWRASDHVSALPSTSPSRGGEGAGTAEETLRTAVHLALTGLLVQAGHTVVQQPGTGDVIVIASVIHP